jgi:hypothetical protein
MEEYFTPLLNFTTRSTLLHGGVLYYTEDSKAPYMGVFKGLGFRTLGLEKQKKNIQQEKKDPSAHACRRDLHATV